MSYCGNVLQGVAETYKIPQLMATAMPILSFILILSPQMSFQGSRARAMSMAAEYALDNRISKGMKQITCTDLYSPAEKMS